MTGVLIGQCQMPFEHVVEAIARGHYLIVAFIALRIDMLLLRRMVLHAEMAPVIDGVVVDGHEIPLAVLLQISGCIVYAARMAQNAHHPLHGLVLFDLSLSCLFHEGQQHRSGQLEGGSAGS